MTLAIYRFPSRLGGDLSLDFCNTTEYRDSERRLEFLRSYDHALAWCWRNELIGEAESARLAKLAATHPTQAAVAYAGVIDLRETIYAVFCAVIAEEVPSAANLARLNVALAATQRQIMPNESGFSWAWLEKDDDLERIGAPIALAAADLLTSESLHRVRQCPNCGWLFVDTSRNHSRRWCSMELCGSQAKSRRQYERKKSEKA